jgi:hypothetical protein
MAGWILPASGQPLAADAKLYFGEIKEGKVRFVSDQSYSIGETLWVFWGSDRKAPMTVASTGPITHTCSCSMQEYYAPGPDGKLESRARNQEFKYSLVLNGPLESASDNAVVLVSNKDLIVARVKTAEKQSKAYATRLELVRGLRDKLVESAGRRLESVDPVAARRNHFPFRSVDTRIVKEGTQFLNETIQEKVFATSRGDFVELIATWKHGGKIIGTFKMSLLAIGPRVVLSKIDDAIFFQMAMPEFKSWDWNKWGFRFGERIYDLGGDGVLELIEKGFGYEATWLSLCFVDFETPRFEILQSQGCGC